MRKLDQIRKESMEMLEELDDLQAKIEKSLRRAPEGTLNLSSSNGTSQYYHKIQKGAGKGKYIEKGNVKLIKALAQKDYDLCMLKDIGIKRRQLEKVIKYVPEKWLDEPYFAMARARKEFVKPYILPDDEYVKEWLEVEYEGKMYPGKFASQLTDRGEHVRSKSEKIIADKLFSMGIPYRYEYPLYIKGFGTIYPDFTLLKLSTREEIYLEHFGMMDDPEYCKTAIIKIQTYARNHIFPGKGLLMSYETSNTSLDVAYIEKMLKEFILH